MKNPNDDRSARFASAPALTTVTHNIGTTPQTDALREQNNVGQAT